MMNQNRSSENISIRNAESDDLGAIKTLYGKLSPDVSNLETDLLALLGDPNATFLILQADNQPIGMVICYVRHSLSSGNKMAIEELVIDHNRRGQGLGSILIKHCIDLAKDQELDCVELTCSLAKPELHKFYEKAGFKHRMKYYSLFPGQR